jgi:transcriptional regulator with XRE-family HTH domain
MPKLTLKMPTELRGFPHRLAEAMVGVTQQELEGLSGISQSAISRLRSGRPSGGSILHVVLIAQALNVRIGWLLVGEGPMRPGGPLEFFDADAHRTADVPVRTKHHQK